MSKGICEDGVSVDKKVREFQENRSSRDFILVQKYYDDFKKYWFGQVEELIERDEFDREWCIKLLHSMDTYDEAKAVNICRTYGWSMTQKFNRWFYSALKNWISNVKTQAFRIKKRPGIICPICLREVCKIEEKHLRHIKTTKDVPKFFEHRNKVYKTYLKPKKECRYYNCTMSEFKKKTHLDLKSSVEKWSWYIGEEPGVMCPFTKNIVSIIDDAYILSLPKKYKNYAKSYSWEEFQEQFPNYMVYSEVMSLDYVCDDSTKNRLFVDRIASNRRLMGGHFPAHVCTYEKLYPSTCSNEYENAVIAIDRFVSDTTDKEILKYILIGYEYKDVCDYVGISRKEFKTRLCQMKSNKLLEDMLVSGIIKS